VRGALVPLVELHRAVLLEVGVHLEGVAEHVRHVRAPLLEALGEGALVAADDDGEVSVSLLDLHSACRCCAGERRVRERDALVHELILVVGVSALLDDERRALPRRQAAQVGETLLSDDHVDVVLGVVDVRGEGDDARDAGRVGLGRAGRGRVHDGLRACKGKVSGTLVEDRAGVGAGDVGDGRGGKGGAEGEEGRAGGRGARERGRTSLAFRRKSPEPPRPFSMREPSAFVELQ